MDLGKIIAPSSHNKYIWLNAFALITFLFTGLADPFAIVMVYFLETVIIGVIHAYKMHYVATHSLAQSKIKNAKPNFKIGFFMVHYSFFIAVQSTFVFAIFQYSDENISEPFYLIQNFKYVLTLKGITYGLLVTLIFIAVQTYFSFIRTKVYNLYTVDRMFIQPYLRIFIQQFAVIIALFFTFIFPDGIVVAILLILLRLAVDLLGVYINSSDKNLRRLAKRLAKNSEHTEDELYIELRNLF